MSTAALGVPRCSTNVSPSAGPTCSTSSSRPSCTRTVVVSAMIPPARRARPDATPHAVPADRLIAGALRGLVFDVFLSGVVVIAAAGNSRRGVPANVMAYPAPDGCVVAVGAATMQGRRAGISRYGGKDPGPARWFMLRTQENRAGDLARLVRIGVDAFGDTSILIAGHRFLSLARRLLVRRVTRRSVRFVPID